MDKANWPMIIFIALLFLSCLHGCDNNDSSGNSALGGVQGQVDELNAQIADLSDKNSDLEDRISNLENRVSDLENER